MKAKTTQQLSAGLLAIQLLEMAKSRCVEAGEPSIALSVGALQSKLDVYLSQHTETKQ